MSLHTKFVFFFSFSFFSPFWDASINTRRIGTSTPVQCTKRGWNIISKREKKRYISVQKQSKRIKYRVKFEVIIQPKPN